MPTEMPDFAMPPEADAPASAAAADAAPATGAAGEPSAAPHATHPERSREPASPSDEDEEPWGRPDPQPVRRPWRLLLAATLVGVLLGAGLVSAVQGMERAAGDGDRARLTEAAMAYLTAIADGRAEEATRLVPPPGLAGAADLLTDPVLAAAGRITEPQAGFAQIEGDEARIEVGFVLGRTDVSRTLEAVREAGGWRVTTSLAERVQNYAYGPGTSSVSLAGVPAASGELLLYPALYMTDAHDDGFVSTQSVTFSVDGDARTAVEISPMVQVAPGVAERLEPVAMAFGLACQLREGCGIPPGELVPTHQVQPYLEGADATQASVYLARSTDAGGELEWHEVRMRGDFADGADAGDWECGMPSLGTGQVEAWEACVP
ncbi:hypothetical protein D8Y24_04740 [Agrococcus lahaulensis]|nr:hypothetical protein D8Y24_04740 [Agrococcus lahaulensis]